MHNTQDQSNLSIMTNTLKMDKLGFNIDLDDYY